MFEWVKEEANIKLEIIDDNEHRDGGINFYIGYIGPLGGIGANKRVKVDISRSELLVFKPVVQAVRSKYSDQEAHQLVCYPLEEVLVEKMRSIIQRMQARDFYDLWYLLEIHGMNIAHFVGEFRVKCETKEIDPSSFFTKLEQRLPQYRGRWQSSMSNQIKDLPDFDRVVREVTRHLRKMEL